jgi:putative protein-disulfide isomerase
MTVMEKVVAQRKNKRGELPAMIRIVYYTDPLCCWSWAFEPVIRQLKYELGAGLTLRYCMGGMLSDWDSYRDSLLAVERPLQMGPVWLQAKQLTGTELDDMIWFRDPPASSYPACVAVKCAARQSPEAEERYLFQLRKAVMMEGKNIAKKEVLTGLAAVLEAEMPAAFSAAQFCAQLGDDSTINAFRADLEERRSRNINRFPSLLISAGKHSKQLLVTGNRPYESLLDLLEKL